MIGFLILTDGFTQCKTNPKPAKLPIGAELEPYYSFSFSYPFVDAIKQIEKFTFKYPADSVDFLDANRWPNHDFNITLAIFVDSFSTSLNGTYSISFNGKANLTLPIGLKEYKLSNQTYDLNTNTTTANLTIDGTLATNPGPNWCVLYFDNTQRTSSSAYNTGITNLKILRPNYANSTQTFTNEFIDHVKRFNLIRFKEWQFTNDSRVVNWSDRTLPTEPSQLGGRSNWDWDFRGVAWEYCIELANLVNADIWVNIPHKASDDYVKQLSVLLKNSLKSNLNIYLEYSNELYDTTWQQYKWNIDTTIAEINGSSNLKVPFEPDTLRMSHRRIARRSIEITKIFESTFGASATNKRIRPVLSFKFSDPEFLNRVFDWVDSTYKKPSSTYFYAVATSLQFDLKGNDVTGYSSTQILDTLQAGLDDLFGGHSNRSNLMVAASNAAYYNVKLICNKGGYNIDGITNANSKMAALMDFRMMDIIDSYLNQWFSYGYNNQMIWYYAGAQSWRHTYQFSSLTDEMSNQATPAIMAIDSSLAFSNMQITKGHLLSTGSLTNIDARLYSNYYSANKKYIGGYPSDYLNNPYLNNIYGTSFNDYLVNAPAAGMYSFRTNHNCHGGPVKLKIAVNNLIADSLAIPIDSGFVDSPTILLNLNEGLNTIRVYYAFAPNYYLDIKYLKLEYQEPCGTTSLPIRFIDFELEVTEDPFVRLHWMTVHEKTVKYFEIERSKSAAGPFVRIDSVPSDNLPAANYQATDHSPLEGTSYYRIKELENDGSFIYTEVRSVQIQPIKLTLTGPNPTHGEVNYKIISPNDKKLEVIITDPTGKILLTKHLNVKKGATNDHIHISPSHQGIYILKVMEENGNYFTSLRLAI